jgi:uncharacterized protein (DUF433 family)
LAFTDMPPYNFGANRGAQMDVKELVEVDPEKMSGTPVFTGTRVPIKHLFDYLEGGDTLEIFLDDFPTVTREQVLGVLELSLDTLLSQYEIAA